jgi:hypothetical protein
MSHYLKELGERQRAPSELPEILKLPEVIENEIKGALPEPHGGHSHSPDVHGGSKHHEQTTDLHDEPAKHHEESKHQGETKQYLTPKSKNPLSRVPDEMDLDSEWEGFTKEYQISQ